MTSTDAASPSAITVRELCKTYKDRTVVDNISLDVYEGETLAILGPNGAGKTTLVEMLEGFRSPISGTLSVLGQTPLSAPRDWRNRIGVVLQESQDTGNVTVREQLKHFSGFYRNPREVDQLISEVGLTEQSGRMVGKLSGGQRRRLDVALSVVGNPELLFLDEPTTGFDPQARLEFWSLIERLKAGGTTIVLTTHYLEEAERLADRVAVVVSGKLKAIGADLTTERPELRTPTVSWVDAEGRHRSQATERPGQFVAELVAVAGGEPDQLRVHQPTLEDVYLALIAEHEHQTGHDHHTGEAQA